MAILSVSLIYIATSLFMLKRLLIISLEDLVDDIIAQYIQVEQEEIEEVVVREPIGHKEAIDAFISGGCTKSKANQVILSS